MARTHHYEMTVHWTGDLGRGTTGYRDFERTHELRAKGKPTVFGSADPAFRGDTDRWNPEELLVAALSQCHMLWYLHLASAAGVVVTGYTDTPQGTMAEDESGEGGQFREVLLRPEVIVADEAMLDKARQLHGDVPARCFVARSVNFPVRHEPEVRAV